MGTVTVFNRSQRRFSGLKISKDKSIDLDAGKSVDLDEKAAEGLLKQYPRDLVKASEVRKGDKELTARAEELSKREDALAAKDKELTARAEELSKREDALKKAEEKK